MNHPYAPDDGQARKGPFVVLEGVSGIGKSTLTAALAQRLDTVALHTLPAPHTDLSSTVNAGLRPLPQLAFYLSGVLHASDVIRAGLDSGPVVADRYVTSVVACHAAVNDVPLADVAELAEPFRPYLIRPDRTFHLRCSESVLRDRLRRKADTKRDDRDLFDVPGRYERLNSYFGALADSDPSAVVLDTDHATPEELTEQIITILEAEAC
jgi:thymidylate kinase